MDSLLEKLFEGKSDLEISQLLTGLNRRLLEQKDHIKKYYRLRKLHSDILDSMISYIENGKYDVQYYTNQIMDDLAKETRRTNFSYDLYDADDSTILTELFVYKNHERIPSLTDIYLEKKIFRNKEKVQMLYAMKNSYVGLFKVVSADRENGYVTYQDVFTKKRFKVIDVSMSSSFSDRKDRALYIYNRIISVDDISFGTGIHCMMTSKNKELMEFIKKHRYKQCRDFSRCVMLYDISKRERDLAVTHNNQYGRR